MYDTFKEELIAKYEKAVEDFEKAKAEAVKDLQNMSTFQAVDYGAAYYTKIDKVTAAGARVMELGQLVRAFEYYESKEDK